MTQACRLRKAQRGLPWHVHGDRGSLAEDDPKPGEQVGDTLVDFPYEGSSLDALKSVGEVNGEDTQIGL